jgi:IMP dehydrogenase
VTPEFSLGSSLPIISANMNAVTGRRMAETLARLGGIGILPQDMDMETLEILLPKIMNASVKFDTPITVKKSHTIRDAMGIIYKRAHNAIILVDDENKPLSIFVPKDFSDQDQYTQLGSIKKSFLIT